MKFLDLVQACKEVEIDCDRCKYQKECSKFSQSLEGASPVMIAKIVQENVNLD